MLNNPHLIARGAFTRLQDGAGEFQVNNTPFRFASVATPVRGLAPSLGEHTRTVLGSVLGLTDSAIDALHAAGAIA